jgi:phosphotransferase system IIB component
MAAGLGFKTFSTGDVLTAGDTNGYLMQGVWVFADAAARTAAVASPQEGNISYLKDTNSTEYYSGAAWVAIGGGSSGGMTLISTTTLTGSSTTINTISGSYKHLLIVAKNIYSSGNDTTRIRLNGDTASNYSDRYLRIQNATVSGNVGNNSSLLIGDSSSNTDWSNKLEFQGWIYRYTDTGIIDVVTTSDGYNGTEKQGNWNNGRYNASAAITSITVLQSGATTYTAGTVYLYGVN